MSRVNEVEKDLMVKHILVLMAFFKPASQAHFLLHATPHSKYWKMWTSWPVLLSIFFPAPMIDCSDNADVCSSVFFIETLYKCSTLTNHNHPLGDVCNKIACRNGATFYIFHVKTTPKMCDEAIYGGQILCFASCSFYNLLFFCFSVAHSTFVFVCS